MLRQPDNSPSNDHEIEAAFVSIPRQLNNGLVFPPDAYFYIRRAQIADLARHYAIPTSFDVRDYVEMGSLMSYGNDFLDFLRLAGRHTGRILKGEKPADLAIARATEFDLVINVATAKALDIMVPPILLAQANDLIE
jgi:putative tryptophan/tyrosine transport system substrate-binding protein